MVSVPNTQRILDHEQVRVTDENLYLARNLDQQHKLWVVSTQKSREILKLIRQLDDNSNCCYVHSKICVRGLG